MAHGYARSLCSLQKSCPGFPKNTLLSPPRLAGSPVPIASRFLRCREYPQRRGHHHSRIWISIPRLNHKRLRLKTNPDRKNRADKTPAGSSPSNRQSQRPTALVCRKTFIRPQAMTTRRLPLPHAWQQRRWRQSIKRGRSLPRPTLFGCSPNRSHLQMYLCRICHTATLLW